MPSLLRDRLLALLQSNLIFHLQRPGAPRRRAARQQLSRSRKKSSGNVLLLFLVTTLPSS
jgi:hypothetical protein